MEIDLIGMFGWFNKKEEEVYYTQLADSGFLNVDPNSITEGEVYYTEYYYEEDGKKRSKYFIFNHRQELITILGPYYSSGNFHQLFDWMHDVFGRYMNNVPFKEDRLENEEVKNQIQKLNKQIEVLKATIESIEQEKRDLYRSLK